MFDITFVVAVHRIDEGAGAPESSARNSSEEILLNAARSFTVPRHGAMCKCKNKYIESFIYFMCINLSQSREMQ